MNKERIEKLLGMLSKEAYVPAPPPMDPAMGGMPPPMDPAMGGMPPPMDPAMGGMPPIPPEMMTGAMPPPEMPPADPESVTLSMTDLKSILQEAVAEAKSGGAVAEKKRSTQELLETLEQKIINIEEQLAALTGELGGGEEMPMDMPPGMPPPNDIAALLGVPQGGPPMDAGMPPEMPPGGVGGMPMEAPPEVPPGPPPLTEEALKTASDNRSKWINKLQSERGAVKEALRLMQGYVRD
jgi:hypothetical protein